MNKYYGAADAMAAAEFKTYTGVDWSPEFAVTPDDAYDTADGTFCDDTDLEPGDVVTLISGGPAMTVLSYCDECGDVEVAWFDEDGALHMQLFPWEAVA